MHSDNDVSSFRRCIITRSHNCSYPQPIAHQNSERYGAVYLVNLFSNIRTPENLKHIKNPYDEHTDIHLMKAISESDTVILAYGAYAKRPVVIDRVEQVMEMLKPHKKKVKKLINPVTNEIMHPLNPKARQKWILKS